MWLMKNSSPAARRSLPVGAALCAVVVAVVFAGGCSPGQRSSAATATPQSTAGGTSSASAAPPSTAAAGPPSVVEHWGALFGARRGENYDLATSPVAVTVPGTVAEIGTSNSTEYALLANGSLYAWGLGTHGQLGDGGRVNSLDTPVRVHFPAGVQIASIPADVMPYDTALAIDTRGNVWGWGQNGGGELCLANTRTYATPVRLPLSGVTAVAGASNHAVYDAGGTVYACGQNLDGVLGDGSRRSTTTPRKVAGLDGSAVTELVASFANAGALLADGEYFDWGYDADGQLGDGHIGRSSDVPVRVGLPHPVAQVAQGGSIWGNGQTLVKLSDGSLWAWGANFNGQLGNETTGMEPYPVRFYPPAGVTYKSLATGSATSYAISATGRVYAWGVSFVGQVGDGTTLTALGPVRVAFRATMISSTANNVAIALSRKT